MLYLVEIDKKISLQADSADVEILRAPQTKRVHELQRAGIWKHSWKVVGQYKNVSVFDVESNEDLHDLLTTLPMFSQLNIKVTPICRHPLSVCPDNIDIGAI